MDQKQPAKVGEIHPSGKALSVAKTWLNLGDSDGLQDSWKPPVEYTKPRPAGLGLGAKPQPKQKEVAQNATAVGKVLGKRLRNVDSSSQRGEPSRPSSGIAATSKHAGESKGKAKAAGWGGDSDEEEGRGSAFSRPKLATAQWTWSQQGKGKKRGKSKHGQPHTAR